MRAIGAAMLFASLVPATAAVARGEVPHGASSPLSPGQHRVRLRGVSLAYHVAGRGPLLVVLAPGWGIGSSYLQAGLAPLERNHRVVYVDERGSGLSGRPADPHRMSYHDMALDLEALRVLWHRDRLDILGHSAGATIAMDYAADHPGRVGRLLLVDAELPGVDVSGARRRVKELWRNDPAHAEAVRHHDDPMPRTDQGFSRYLRQTLAWYFADPKQNAGPFLAAIPARLPVWTLRASIMSDRAQGLRSRLMPEKVEARTYVIVGQDDAECPPEMARAIQRRIAGSRLVVIPGAGHFPWIEARQRFFEVLSAFLIEPDDLPVTPERPSAVGRRQTPS